MGCGASIDAGHTRASAEAPNPNQQQRSLDPPSNNEVAAALGCLRECHLLQLQDTADILDKIVVVSRGAKVNKHNCSSLCTLSVLSGVALCRVLDSVASSSEALQELQPRFEAINKALEGVLKVLEQYSSSKWLAHVAHQQAKVAQQAGTGRSRPGPFTQEFKAARDALIEALKAVAVESTCLAAMDLIKTRLSRHLQGEDLRTDMEDCVAAVVMAAGGETLSQALQRMREEGEAGAALLAEAARVFNVAPGLLDASLNSLAAVLAPAAAELAGALEGALDVFDSLLEGLDTLPMGVGAALRLVKVVLRRAQGVQVNKRACAQLKSLVEGVGDTLARYVQHASEQQRRDLEGPLAGLTAHLREADSLLERFGAGSWLRHFLYSRLATRELAEVHAKIYGGMAHLNLNLALQQHCSGGGGGCKVQPAAAAAYEAQDDLRAAEAAVIDAAGGEANGVASAVEAVKVLQGRGQLGIAKVARCFGVAEAVMRTELEGIKDLLQDVARVVQGTDIKVDRVMATLKHIKKILDENEGFEVPANLAIFLLKFWKDNVGGILKSVQWHELKVLLKALFEEDIQLCGHMLRGLLAQLGTPPIAGAASTAVNDSGSAAAAASDAVDPGDVFLDVALMPLLDVNHDMVITVQELYVFQVQCQALAKRRRPPPPLETMGDMMRVVAEAKQPAGRAAAAHEHRQVPALTAEQLASLPPSMTAILKEGMSMVNSYALADLLQDYLDGSRQWMYDKVMAWLRAQEQQQLEAAAAAEQPAASTLAGSQGHQHVFLLLAEAGMGKSVFTASLVHFKLPLLQQDCIVAHHFFRVGQRRAQGRAMIVSLAAQLAVSLPGMSAALQASLEEQQAAAANEGGTPLLQGDWLTRLPLTQAFEWLLEAPLNSVNQQRLQQEQEAGGAAPSSLQPTTVLLVLDALDEADSDGAGWTPVVQMLTARFRRLPPWVRLFITGRPEVQELFDEGWRQEWINPQDMQNSNDLQVLLERSLASRHYVKEADRTAAAQVLLRKSEGRFIYCKYIFKSLQARRLDGAAAWTLPELEELPYGLTGVYTHELDRVAGALQRDGKAGLLDLLRARLLPVLAVMQEPLTATELVLLMGGQQGVGSSGSLESDVELLLSLISTLYPRRTGAADGLARVAPYHKSVRDFLVEHPAAVAQTWHVDEAAAHASVAQALAWACQVTRGRGARDQLCQAAKSGTSSSLSSGQLPPPLADNTQPALPPYALQHMFNHVVKGLAAAAGSAGLMDDIMQDYALIAAIFNCGAGWNAVRALRPVKSSPHLSPFGKDSVRWIMQCAGALSGEDNALPIMEALKAPMGTAVFQEARAWFVQQFSDVCPWVPSMSLGGSQQWYAACDFVCVGHKNAVSTLCFSPDSRSLVSGSEDKTLRVWDAASGECKAKLSGHRSAVISVCFSPDGRSLVSGSDDSALHVWDAASGKCKAKLGGHRNVVSMCFSPDGRSVVRGSNDSTFSVWDAASGQRQQATLRGHSSAVSSVCFSPDGRSLVSGSFDKTLRVWDAASWECKAMLSGHRSAVISVCFSPDARSLVSGSYDKTLHMWDAASGECKAKLCGHRDRITSVCFSPDGRSLVSGSDDKTLRVWDAICGERQQAKLCGHSNTVSCVLFSPDGRTLVSGSYDETLRMWDAASGECKAKLKGPSSAVISICFSPDGRSLVCCSYDMALHMWDASSGEYKAMLSGHSDRVTSVCFSPDGRSLVSGSLDSTLRVWSAASGKCKATLSGHSRAVISVCFSPDGHSLVSGSEDKTLRVWDPASGECKAKLSGHSRAVISVCFSPDGRSVVSGSNDNTLRMWDAVSGECKAKLRKHSSAVTSVCFSPDGRSLVSGSEDSTLRVWDAVSRKCKAKLSGHSSAVSSVCFSPDGRSLVSGSEDSTLRVWDAASWKCKAKLCGHSSAVSSVCFSPDGCSLVSGSHDETLRMWHAAR